MAAVAVVAGCASAGTDVATDSAPPAHQEGAAHAPPPHEVAGLSCEGGMVGNDVYDYPADIDTAPATADGASPEAAIRASLSSGSFGPLARRMPPALPAQAQRDGFYAENRKDNQVDAVFAKGGKRIARYRVEKIGNNWLVVGSTSCDRELSEENARG